MSGMGASNADYACLYCRVNRKRLHETNNEKRDELIFSVNGEDENQNYPPIFNIRRSRIIIDVMHMYFRIWDRLFKDILSTFIFYLTLRCESRAGTDKVANGKTKINRDNVGKSKNPEQKATNKGSKTSNLPTTSKSNKVAENPIFQAF